MAALNSFTPFDVATETWESYIERFDCFLEANDLVDLTSSRKAAAVHHEEAFDEDNDTTGEDDIHQLKTASGNKWPISKTPQAQTCIGCGGNHLQAVCRFKTSNCQRCRKKGHLARMCRAILPADRIQANPLSKGRIVSQSKGITTQ
ncbi:hypothetical protein E2320_010778 [Naja naja]|nr:hypothetical protein E2320_010778 [Naja naja]